MTDLPTDADLEPVVLVARRCGCVVSAGRTGLEPGDRRLARRKGWTVRTVPVGEFRRLRAELAAVREGAVDA